MSLKFPSLAAVLKFISCCLFISTVFTHHLFIFMILIYLDTCPILFLPKHRVLGGS
jgi:hypothetical protein